MRRGLTTILLIMLGLLLWGCGSASQSNPSPKPSAAPSELVNEAFVTPDDGSARLWKSARFTTHGGPLMVHLTVTRWGTAVYPGLENQGWTGMINCNLEVPGDYWDPAAAPGAGFSLDPQTDKHATQILTSDGTALPPAGTYVLRVEAQNFDGTITILELP